MEANLDQVPANGGQSSLGQLGQSSLAEQQIRIGTESGLEMVELHVANRETKILYLSSCLGTILLLPYLTTHS